MMSDFAFDLRLDEEQDRHRENSEVMIYIGYIFTLHFYNFFYDPWKKH